MRCFVRLNEVSGNLNQLMGKAYVMTAKQSESFDLHQVSMQKPSTLVGLQVREGLQLRCDESGKDDAEAWVYQCKLAVCLILSRAG